MLDEYIKPMPESAVSKLLKLIPPDYVQSAYVTYTNYSNTTYAFLKNVSPSPSKMTMTTTKVTLDTMYEVTLFLAAVHTATLIEIKLRGSGHIYKIDLEKNELFVPLCENPYWSYSSLKAADIPMTHFNGVRGINTAL